MDSKNSQILNTVTIIPNPTWEQTLDLLKTKKSIRINTKDYEKFTQILNSIPLNYIVEHDYKSRLTRFTLMTAN